MRKTLISLIILISLISGSCSSNLVVDLRGIEQYDPTNSSMSISQYLLPCKDFLKKYPYITGDYFYIDTGAFARRTIEQELMYLNYKDDIYDEVKNISLTSFPLSLTHQYFYNGYVFYESLLLPKLYNELDADGESRSFPNHFNMISYNGEKKVLVFIGFYLYKGDMSERDKELLTFSDMGAFLKEYFSFYDFDA